MFSVCSESNVSPALSCLFLQYIPSVAFLFQNVIASPEDLGVLYLTEALPSIHISELESF